LRLLGIEELCALHHRRGAGRLRLQGVKITTSTIEVIVRQMLRRIEVEEPGDSPFITGEQVERAGSCSMENEKAEKAARTRELTATSCSASPRRRCRPIRSSRRLRSRRRRAC